MKPRSPRCWIICRVKPFSFCASRNRSPFTPKAYEQQIPKDDPFFISWPDFLQKQTGAASRRWH
jgi:hypothetical protein